MQTIFVPLCNVQVYCVVVNRGSAAEAVGCGILEIGDWSRCVTVLASTRVFVELVFVILVRADV